MLERDSYFDNLKFILIFFVVLGHAIEPFLGGHMMKTIYLWIYSFHMPLFVFVTGYFSKNINSADYADKLLKGAVIPYLIFETLYSLFDYLVFKREMLVYSYFTPYWIMWFMFSLIIWKVLLPYVVKFKYALPISIVLAILIGYASDAGYYASISRTIVFFPFFLAGYYFNKRYLVVMKNIYFRLVATLTIILVFVGYYINSANLKQEWFYGSFPYKALGFEEWYAGGFRLGIIVLAVLLGASIMSLIPKRQIIFITNLGKNTIYVYLLHAFIIRYLTTTSFFSYFNTTLKKLLLVLLVLAVTILLSLNITKSIFQYLVNPTKIFSKHFKNKSFESKSA